MEVIIIGSAVLLAAIGLLVKFLPSMDALRIGILTMSVGLTGIVVTLLALIDQASPSVIHAAALISGAVIFGCGAFATVVAKKIS